MANKTILFFACIVFLCGFSGMSYAGATLDCFSEKTFAESAEMVRSSLNDKQKKEFDRAFYFVLDQIERIKSPYDTDYERSLIYRDISGYFGGLTGEEFIKKVESMKNKGK